MLAAASDRTPDAAWLCLQVRANQYIGSGHHHADVGMFWFSGQGVDWITELPYNQVYDGKLHNEVLIDGIAEPDGLPARGDYLGGVVSPDAAFGTADQTQSYTYRWTNQVITWDDVSTGGPWSGYGNHRWRVSDDPLAVAVYKGTERYKSRPWWPTYDFSNWTPVSQTPFNPVRYAFRSAGLVRGAHPYGFVVDDLKKDDASHLYQWCAMAGSGVGAAASDNSPDLLLARKADMAGGVPKAGAPVLLLRVFGADGQVPAKFETATDGPPDKKTGQPQPYDRIVAGGRMTQAAFKTLLLPMQMGQTPPTTTYDPASGRLTVQWGDQKDECDFTTGADGRTRFVLTRAGKTLATVK